MNWFGDYMAFCFAHGFGGLVLLALTGFAALTLVLGVLAATAQLARAFAEGWREVFTQRRGETQDR